MLPHPVPPVPAAVLWDFDGTLADTEPSWFAAEYALAAEYDAAWSQQDALALVGSDLLDSASYIRDRMGLDLDPAEIVAQLMHRVLADVEEAVEWRPGALDLLGVLGAAGVPCALVTMSYRRLVDAALAHLPDHAFQVVVAGDEVEHGKPHPEAYATAVRRLGVDPGRCVAIEDSDTGATSAGSAGVHVLVVPNTVPVPGGPGRTLADSLVGIGVDTLAALVDAAVAAGP